MISHFDVGILFSKMYMCWFAFHNLYHVPSSIQWKYADWDKKYLWEDNIKARKRIKGICFIDIRALLWSQIRTKLVNCVLYKYVYFIWKLGKGIDCFFHASLPHYLDVVDIKYVACELQIIHLNLTQENPQKIRCILKKSVACEFQIIHLNLTQKNPQLLLPGNMLEFT